MTGLLIFRRRVALFLIVTKRQNKKDPCERPRVGCVRGDNMVKYLVR